MNRILKKENLTPSVIRFRISAPVIARRHQAGQFIILRSHEDAERIPMSVANVDREGGWIELVVQIVGAGTERLSRLKEGDRLHDLAGPLGRPTHIEKFGRCLCVGGGVGIAPLYPIVRALREAGNHVTTILGARTGDMLILTEEMGALSDEFLVATDDGTKGSKGTAADLARELFEKGGKFDQAFVIGPAMMMKMTSQLILSKGIPTVVSLNPIMIDGTGMCGGCRVEVHGKTKFGCVDGPEFDAAGVDWDLFMKRLRSYETFEKMAKERLSCRINRI